MPVREYAKVLRRSIKTGGHCVTAAKCGRAGYWTRMTVIKVKVKGGALFGMSVHGKWHLLAHD